MRDVSVESMAPGFSLTRYNNLLVAVAGFVSAGLLYFGTGILNLAPEGTFYARTGDWFARLCVAAFVVLFASGLVPQSPIA